MILNVPTSLREMKVAALEGIAGLIDLGEDGIFETMQSVGKEEAYWQSDVECLADLLSIPNSAAIKLKPRTKTNIIQSLQKHIPNIAAEYSDVMAKENYKQSFSIEGKNYSYHNAEKLPYAIWEKVLGYTKKLKDCKPHHEFNYISKILSCLMWAKGERPIINLNKQTWWNRIRHGKKEEKWTINLSLIQEREVIFKNLNAYEATRVFSFFLSTRHEYLQKRIQSFQSLVSQATTEKSIKSSGAGELG